jgi:hypothetical protein
VLPPQGDSELVHVAIDAAALPLSSPEVPFLQKRADLTIATIQSNTCFPAVQCSSIVLLSANTQNWFQLT